MSGPLIPLSWLYGACTRARNLLFDYGWLPVYQASLPVISVGNITVGGNGKTPLVLYIIKLLKEQKLRPCVVTRGYGGKVEQPHLVQESDSPEVVGDEALMLKQVADVPVVVSPRRRKGIELVEQQELGDVVLLDDGFQHRYVQRDLDIITHYLGSELSVRDFLRAWLLPAGRFREDLSQALRRASCVVFASRSMQRVSVPAEVQKSVSDVAEVFTSHLDVEGVFQGREELSLDEARTFDWVLICAIANPDGFSDTVQSLGLNVVGIRSFKDHFAFDQASVGQLEKEYTGVKFICTSKDMIKLAPYAGDLWYELRVGNVVEDGETFKTLIINSITSALERLSEDSGD